MQRATALTLVMAAAFFHGVTAARAAALEVGGGPRQRWDCVAFVADGDIYVVNLDGTGLTRLTADDAFDHSSPAFSPDGTKIAFTSERGDDCAVYVMNVDGTDKRRLSPPYDVPEPELETYEDVAALFGAGGDTCPVFAPNGEIIAATRVFPCLGEWDYEIIFFPTSGGPEENFYTKIEDAWERERHTSAAGYGPCGDIGDPTFSGDGRRVAFRDYPGVSVSSSRLWVANADGSGVRLLTNGDRDNFSPALSPDGKKIIYESSVRRGLFDVSDIYIMNVDGSERRALTRTPVDESNACFTPDGSKIVFEAWPHSHDDSAESGIYVMNADGSGRRFLAKGGSFSLGPSLVEGRLLDSYGNWHDVVEESEATPRSE